MPLYWFSVSHVLDRDSGHGTLSPPPAALQPLFTFAYQDPVLIQDSRVFRNMLEIEEFYLAASNYFQVCDRLKIAQLDFLL